MAVITKLERAVFALMGEDHPAIAERLARFVASATVTQRQNTGHGFYTTFEVDTRQRTLQSGRGPVDGPLLDVQVGHQVLTMGFLLWLTDGHPSCLEGFQYGTVAGGHVDLKEVDLNSLDSLGRLPPTLRLQ